MWVMSHIGTSSDTHDGINFSVFDAGRTTHDSRISLVELATSPGATDASVCGNVPAFGKRAVQAKEHTSATRSSLVKRLLTSDIIRRSCQLGRPSVIPTVTYAPASLITFNLNLTLRSLNVKPPFILATFWFLSRSFIVCFGTTQ